MNCTSCNKGILKPVSIEDGLAASKCSNCNGHWILINDFISWTEKYPEYEFNNNIPYEKVLDDTKKALICPASGSIMTKFHISATSLHRLDFSSATGGIWLDDGEWELLKSEGIAGSLHSLVTEEWQQHIRQITTEKKFSDFYADKFGFEVYSKVKEFKVWLENHEQKEDLKAYLMAVDPYSAEK